ncbi:MAG TPA: hypothetical protein VGV38_14815, partial [Pyrinomonadaceae bacterium]|nr:hypothetical protein [Pyrinomonadaceae bacterium]
APVLMLHGVAEPPVTKRECVEATVRALGLDGAPFARIMSLRDSGAGALRDAEANELFAAYLAQIEAVIAAVDRLEVTSGREVSP